MHGMKDSKRFLTKHVTEILSSLQLNLLQEMVDSF